MELLATDVNDKLQQEMLAWDINDKFQSVRDHGLGIALKSMTDQVRSLIAEGEKTGLSEVHRMLIENMLIIIRNEGAAVTANYYGRKFRELGQHDDDGNI